MKKHFLPAILAITIAFGSCKKKTNEGPTDGSIDDLFKLEYSNLTTEEHKKDLEKSGTELVQEFKSLPDEEFIDVLTNFSKLNFEDIDLEVIGVSNVLTISNAASKKDLKRIFTSATTSTEKISDYYAVYTWRPDSSKFTKTASSSKLEFIFPSDDTKTSNDAILTLTYQAAQTSMIDGESLELPKNITTILKVNNVEQLKITTAHEYKIDGTPTKAAINLVLGAFTMACNVSNDGTKASSSFSVKKGAKNLMSINSNADGNITVTEFNKDENPENIVKNATTTFEVMNFKFAGVADIKSIASEVAALTDTSQTNKIKKEAAIWNKYAQFVVVNTSNNSLIAKVQFEGISEQDCYSYYDYYLNQTINYCYTSTSLDPRLVFKDGSKQTLEAFTDSGFAALITEVENLADKFE